MIERRVKYGIITHADFDGIASAVRMAAYLMKKYKITTRDIWIRFCQPTEVHKIKGVIPSSVENIYVLDIGPNNADLGMTINFIEYLGDRLAGLREHHLGWQEILRRVKKPELFVVDETARACAEIVESDGSPELELLKDDAVYADTRLGDGFSDAGLFIERAIKADQTDQKTLRSIVWYLLGDESKKWLLRDAEKRYRVIEANTVNIANAGYKVIGNIARIDINDLRGVDLTKLLVEGQNMVKQGFAIVVALNKITIATYRQDVNLLDMFGLPSGAMRRISLPAERLAEVIEKLQNFKTIAPVITN